MYCVAPWLSNAFNIVGYSAVISEINLHALPFLNDGFLPFADSWQTVPRKQVVHPHMLQTCSVWVNFS